MWRGKDSKRTFLLQAQFIYLHPPPHSLRRTISPSLPRSRAFSLVTVGSGGLGRRGCCGDSSSLTLLWEESRFFWHQCTGGRDGGWCGVRRGIDCRRLFWMARLYSARRQFHVLQQAYTCSHSRLYSHIYYVGDAYCMCPRIRKVNTVALGFVEKVKMCGNYVRVASGRAGGGIYPNSNLPFPCVLDMPRYGSSHTSQQVICLVSWDHFSAVDSVRCTFVKGKEWSSWLKTRSAAVILKGHLFHPNNPSDSKYMTNVGLDNEQMNPISR